MSPRWLECVAISALARVLPKSGTIVVHGFPSTEGNSVEVVRHLGREGRRRVVWLDGIELLAAEFPNVRVVRKSSVLGVWEFCRASAVFFTHGLYAGSSTGRRCTVVNLWHGDGIKRKDWSKEHTIRPKSDFVTGGTELLTKQKARDFGLDEDRAIVCGNPRIDAFQRSIDESALVDLGIDPERPFVVWLPTFRQSKDIGQTRGRTELSSSDISRDGVVLAGSALCKKLGERGWQVVVKPHPMDSWPYDGIGAIVVSDDELARKSVSLYQLLGESSALVTDFSSVWTDYLYLDRCIGFLVPDAEEYQLGRGLFPEDVMAWLPGVVCEDPKSISILVADILGGGTASRDRRKRARDRLGLVDGSAFTDRLFHELAARGMVL